MAILTFKKDYTSAIILDNELMGVPTSGDYWNVGTSPLVTINNILAYLPNNEVAASAYAAGTTYGIGDLVTSSSVMYQSLTAGNVGHTPDSSPTYWLDTNSDSQKVKAFLNQVYENAESALKLDRKLFENQYIYHIGKSDKSASSDFMGWAFEHKFSDYVTIRLNKIAFQGNTDQEVTFSIVNNGTVIDTFAVTPNNGRFEWSDVNKTMSGFGVFYVVTDAISVKSDGEVHDPLKYKGMICYPVQGNGLTVNGTEYNISSSGNGMGFNVTVACDTSSYIETNEIDFVEVYKWQLAYDLVQMMLLNPNVQSSRDQRHLSEYNMNLLTMEAKDGKLNTIAAKYNEVVKEAKEAISRSFDNMLKFHDKELTIKHGTL